MRNDDFYIHLETVSDNEVQIKNINSIQENIFHFLLHKKLLRHNQTGKTWPRAPNEKK